MWNFIRAAVKIARRDQLRSRPKICALIRQLHPEIDGKALSRYCVVRAIVHESPLAPILPIGSNQKVALQDATDRPFKDTVRQLFGQAENEFYESRHRGGTDATVRNNSATDIGSTHDANESQFARCTGLVYCLEYTVQQNVLAQDIFYLRSRGVL